MREGLLWRCASRKARTRDERFRLRLSGKEIMKEAPGTRDYDWWLLAILATICALGVIEIYSATHGSSLAGMHMKQMRWLPIGFIAMFALSRLAYHLILDHSPILSLVAVAPLLTSFFFRHTRSRPQPSIPLLVAHPSLQPP